MALRIRESGEVVCAAMHPAEPGDTYLHDGISYRLTVELRALVTDRWHLHGPGGETGHGLWWWLNEVPDDVTPEPFPVDTPEGWDGEVCKRCFRHSVVGFVVPDEMWEQVVDGRYTTLCLSCFDTLAASHGVAWDRVVRLYPVSTQTWRESVA